MKELLQQYIKAVCAFVSALIIAAAYAVTTGADLSDWKVWLGLVASVLVSTGAVALAPANKPLPKP